MNFKIGVYLKFLEIFRNSRNLTLFLRISKILGIFKKFRNSKNLTSFPFQKRSFKELFKSFNWNRIDVCAKFFLEFNILTFYTYLFRYCTYKKKKKKEHFFFILILIIKFNILIINKLNPLNCRMFKMYKIYIIEINNNLYNNI